MASPIKLHGHLLYQELGHEGRWVAIKYEMEFDTLFNKDVKSEEAV